MFQQDSHLIHALDKVTKDQIVTIRGFVEGIRNHGDLIFLDIRDATGQCQVVAAPDLSSEEVLEAFKTLRCESTVEVSGYLRTRPEGTANDQIFLGDIELVAQNIQIYSLAEPLPFSLDDKKDITENLLLKYRYLAFRLPRFQKNLQLRFQFIRLFRETFYADGFTEIETPYLFKSTPEGARDFLVPSRLHARTCYALVQSPQLMKELLMIGGFPRYIQIARCFRDEDARSDRQPEFSHIDIEASFISPKAFCSMIEKNFLKVLKKLQETYQTLKKQYSFQGQAVESRFLESALPESFPTISYEDALNSFGSDKPDYRWDMPLRNVTSIFAETGFKAFKNIVDQGGRIMCLPVPVSLTRSFLDTLPQFALNHGIPGLAWIKIQEEGWQGPAAKFFSDQEKAALLEICKESAPLIGEISEDSSMKVGSVMIFCALKKGWQACEILGQLRLKIIEEQNLTPKRKIAFCWVKEWPLLEWDQKEKSIFAMHHPFTTPDKDSMKSFLETDVIDVKKAFEEGKSPFKAEAYDLVCNGWEIAGGSQRIHQREVLKKMFEYLDLSPEDQDKKFGFFLEALRYGVPPHLGIAFGLDRVVAIICDETSIRDVMAFPKTGSGTCLLSECPSPVDETQLRDLSLRWREKTS